MMDYSKILQSPRFTFLVGAEETSLTIHAALLKHLSEPLNAMVNNGVVKESRSGVAVLEDVDVEVFAAFCEFAYTRNYESTLANYMVQRSESDNEVVGSSDDDDHNNDLRNTKFDVKKMDTENDVDERDNEEKRFDEWNLELRLNFTDFYDREFQDDFRWAPSGDIKDVEPDLTFTVKVYVFATRYLIEPLRQYCLRYLHHELRGFRLGDFNSDAILKLLEHTYASTSNQEPTGPSLMRDLVIHYVACKFTILSRNKDFACLLKSNAEIGSDLFVAMTKWKCKRVRKCTC